MSKKQKNILIAVLFLTAVVSSGLVMTVVLVEYGQKELRLDLLRHACIAASGFAPKEVESLIRPQQNQQKVCAAVWTKMENIQLAIPHMRNVYLMHLVDNQVRFLADGHDKPCSDYSSNEAIYAEASVELQNVFVTGQAFVEGPLVDKWGSWVSGIAPIVNPQTGAVIAVIGLDIDTAIYNSKIAIYRGFGVTVTVLTALLVLLLLTVVWRARNGRDRLAKLNLSLSDEIVERQRAQSCQQQQLHFLQVLIDAISYPVFYRDTFGKYLGCNRAFEILVGKSKKEIIGKSVYDHSPPERADIYAQADRDLLVQGLGGIQTYERNIPSAEGERLEVIFSKAAFPTMDGKLGGIIGTIVDISKRKEMEEALKESESLFRSIFDNTAAGVITVTFKGEFIKANPAFCQMLGYSETELVKLGQHDITHPDDLESAEIIYRDVVQKKPEKFEIVKRYLRKDNTIVWVHITGSWVYGGENLIHAVLLVLDITERKQAEEALKKSEQGYRLLYQQFNGLLNAIPDTIMLISADMNIVWANRGAKNQFEHCDGLQKQYCFSAWRGLEQPCEGCPVQRCFDSGEHEEQRMYGEDGRVWAVRAYPLKDEYGKVLHVIDVCSDITDKIRLRTEADRNSRLASLGELAAGIAHEINNPNGLILLNTPMLKEVFSDALCLFGDYYQQHGHLELGGLDYQELCDELPTMLKRIEGAAVRIKRIVEDLKNFVSQGEFDLSGQLDLNEVAQAAIRLVDNSIKKSTDHFETAFGVLPPGQGDFQWIEQVVINLVQNACLALTDRSSHIRLVTYFDSENRCNILQVQDDGVGIAPESLSHVTDPFYTTRRESGGTGLGLSVSARIVREHGGQLEFQSTLGVGTMVTMKLPIIKEGE